MMKLVFPEWIIKLIYKVPNILKNRNFTKGLFLGLILFACGKSDINHPQHNDFEGNHGGHDIWVVKTDDTGDIQWQNCYGGTKDEFAEDILQTSDGGYAVVGSTNDGGWLYYCRFYALQ